MNFLSLFWNETKLSYLETKQYWFEAITSMGVTLGVFTAIFYGVKSIADIDEAGGLDGFVFGFFLWTFASLAFLSVSKGVIEDNQKGFLEQLFLCPGGVTYLLCAKLLAELVIGMVFLVLIAYLSMFTTGNWISINFPYFLLLLFVSSFSVVGVGFILTGFALVYKRVQMISFIFNMSLMGIVAVPALPVNIFSLLPFAAGASLCRDIILHGNALQFEDLQMVIANSLVYFAGGLFVFEKMAARAKKLNLLGQY